MPISIVVGGQFGSEGKGKVALEIVRRSHGPVTVIRVGGPNSGHTAYDRDGKKWALRQMPAACIDRNVDVVFPAGSYLDTEILLREINELDYPLDRIYISKYASLITPEQIAWEEASGLVGSIGSTGSGVGAALLASAARGAKNFPLEALHAGNDARLEKFRRDTTALLHKKLLAEERVVIEGTQGFGLSLLDGGHWPKATARCTTAAAALAEAGLSPLLVDNVTMVLRAFPIRVAGDSGPLPGETSWARIAQRSGLERDIREYTTVTKKERRVGEFDASSVRRAIRANTPNRIVLNHLDYVGPAASVSNPNSAVSKFIRMVSSEIMQRIDWYGFSELGVLEANGVLA
ncbi:adenylosuccinate synthetase [Mesorhizobium sp. M1423]|uniref:adenylosuccinate synthetase n=1 Tax=Mesorhizobium sp. M1423 TaxID=2957101 RepID=UPI00333A80C7